MAVIVIATEMASLLLKQQTSGMGIIELRAGAFDIPTPAQTSALLFLALLAGVTCEQLVPRPLCDSCENQNQWIPLGM